MFFYSEGFAGAVGIPVGGFAEDRDAATDAALTPRQMYWASRKRAWVHAPEGAEVLDGQ